MSQRTPTVRYQVMEILKENGGPMTAREITEKLLKKYSGCLNGKTPVNTVSALLQRCLSFKKISRGLYELREYDNNHSG